MKQRLRALLGLAAFVAAACVAGGGGTKKRAVNGCPDDIAFFEQAIWKPILSVKCIGCHIETGPADGTALILTPSDQPDYLRKNFDALKAVAALSQNQVPLLLLRPTGLHPEGHLGGALVPPNSEHYQNLETFVARVTRGEACDAPYGAAACSESVPGQRLLRRLTRDEYDRTVRDLLGIEASHGQSFSVDTVVNGFDNNASALQTTPLLADQIFSAAEKLAATAVQNLDAILPCDPVTTGEAACARQFVQSFGRRAFRRPLENHELDRYVGLYAETAVEDGFASAVELVLTALLQSPHFLYRPELGSPSATGVYDLSPWEIASELSYLIWGTMPDDALFQAAESGALTNPAEIERQARRLLADPRSDAIIARFIEQWLELDRLANVPKDATTFPGFDEGTRAALREEVLAFTAHVRRSGTNALPELLTASYSLLSPELAAFYGAAAPPGTGFTKVELPEGTRAGVLTLGGVLASHSLPSSSSPIHRGKLVRERLLCQVPAPPPPNLNAKPPPVHPSQTTRERFAVHASVEPCKSCHRLLDPIGFAFEGFDGIGRYRADDNGQPLDLSGEIVNTARTDGVFQGPAELGARLAASPDVHECVALQWFRYGYGLSEAESSSCTVRQLSQAFGDQGLKLDELVVALTQTPHFLRRVADPASSDTPVTGDAGAGTSDAGAPTTDGGTPSADAPPPPPPPDLMVTEMFKDQWAQGFCSDVTVKNLQNTAVTWVVSLTIAGTLQTVWGAVAEQAGTETRFRGEFWNAQLAPGAETMFGYCAGR